MELEEAEGNVIDTIVIGADTVVVHDNKILGKPSDEAEAFRMIKSLAGDADANYCKVMEYKAEDFVPVMACPSQVDKIRNVSELEGTEIDQVFIGSCTNGRLEDLAAAADETGGAAFAMYPTSMEELMTIADEGKLMPPKSTWFEPKLRSGLFIHKLSD